jgi:hypothetical protein
MRLVRGEFLSCQEEKEKEIIEAAIHSTPADATHWSVRTMAEAQKISSPLKQYPRTHADGATKEIVKRLGLSNKVETCDFVKTGDATWSYGKRRPNKSIAERFSSSPVNPYCCR